MQRALFALDLIGLIFQPMGKSHVTKPLGRFSRAPNIRHWTQVSAFGLLAAKNYLLR
jgi:hypothetical protein